MESTQKFEISSSMIGQFVNRYSYSDATPVGKIIGISGKNTLIIQCLEAGPNLTKMEFIPGGFAGVCTNQYAQRYEFHETGKTIRMRYSKRNFGRYHRIESAPYRFYDYNF